MSPNTIQVHKFTKAQLIMYPGSKYVSTNTLESADSLSSSEQHVSINNNKHQNGIQTQLTINRKREQ